MNTRMAPVSPAKIVSWVTQASCLITSSGVLARGSCGQDAPCYGTGWKPVLQCCLFHNRIMPRLPFITFEGSEGCGKSTQVQRLAVRLKDLQIPFLVTREPGGTPIGETIRELLQFASHNSAMMPETELLLFEASRSQLVRETIKPALERGV